MEKEEEEWIPISRAAKFIPGRPHNGTVQRWSNLGVDGRVLKSVLVGGRRFTRREWIQQFIDAGAQPSAPSPNTSSQRRQSVEDAQRELTRLGF